jgi:CDP-2,3-bis-(O-geranylgeranyl)-sn-glycerol synthase
VPLLILVVLANGTPMVAHKLFGNRCSYPVDGDRAFLDGRPVLGRSKTIRGVALAIVITAAAAPLVGLDWKIGALVGSLAMAGDLFSSFLKRRLGRSPSSPAVGLDQIPESLFPLLGCLGPLALSFADVAAGVGVFFVGELLFSRLLYAFDLRDRPY